MNAPTSLAAVVAHLTAEVARLTAENSQFAAQVVIDEARIKRLLAEVPKRPAREVWAKAGQQQEISMQRESTSIQATSMKSDFPIGRAA